MRKYWITISIVYFFIFSIAGLTFLYQKRTTTEPDSVSQLPASLLPTSTPRATASPTPLPLPSSKILGGGTHTFQTFNNCGPSALSMALSYYDIFISQQILGQDLRPYQNPQGNNDDKSVTLAELAKKGEELGFIPYHRPAGSIDLIKKLTAQDIPVMTRTWLKPNEDIGHYRVVKGYDDVAGVVIQDDSLQGKDLRYSYSDFSTLWQAFNYEFLILVPVEKKEVVEALLGELANEDVAWQQALLNAESDIEQNPSNIYAVFNKSVALYYLQRYQESIDTFEQVESRLPSRMLWYQLEPILAYYQVGNFPRVLQISEGILNNQNRAYSELHYLGGKIFESQGESARAQETFRLADFYNTTELWKSNLPEEIL